jgi:hypothetical protein
MKTNWEELSKKLGVLNLDGSETYLGQSMQAIEEILGDEWIENTIDCFIEGKKGNELAIKTIRRIGSNKAAAYAHKIFTANKETNIQKAQLAVWAMSDIRMPICMNYVEECIGTTHYEGIAIAVMRNLLYENVIIYGEKRINSIFDKIDKQFQEDILPLKKYVKQQFKEHDENIKNEFN